MRIITGSTGATHVTSNDDGQFNQSIWGNSNTVLAMGNKLSAAQVDNNNITVSDGCLMIQGRFAVIDPDTTENITIGTGTIGQNRNDLIVARYELNNTTGFESITLEVIEGTPSSGTASDPVYNTGDIRTGDLKVDYPLYRVKISGLNITAVEKLFSVQTNIIDKIGGFSNCVFLGSITPTWDSSNSFTISNAAINENSLIDIYYEDKYDMSPQYSQGTGWLKIQLDDDPPAGVTVQISNVKVVNI